MVSNYDDSAFISSLNYEEDIIILQNEIVEIIKVEFNEIITTLKPNTSATSASDIEETGNTDTKKLK